MNIKRDQFPKDFIFGAATSSYQIEGHGFGGAGYTHWDEFAATSGKVVRNENGAIACDHYHRYEEDFNLLQNAGFDAYRFSTSWARILPEGKGTINQEGLDYYDRLVDSLLERDLEPHLTLYHWELPQVMNAMGGWQNRDVVKYFADYCEIILNRIGSRISSCAAINEPWCVAWLSHFHGAHAPGLEDLRVATRAMHHVLLAHGMAIEVGRSLGIKKLGGVFNFERALPAQDNEASHFATQIYDGLYNRWYIEGVRKGTYPQDILEYVEPHMPEDWQKDMALISAPIDWIGINYYTRKLIDHDGSKNFPFYKEVEGPLDKTQMGWEIYPQGLHDFLTWIDKNYADGLPLYITENGMANKDDVFDGQIKDYSRISFIEAHLEKVLEAKADGVNVQGYFYWSLLDNYEWALGYEKQFGLIHVDFETLKRAPKASYDWFMNFLKF